MELRKVMNEAKAKPGHKRLADGLEATPKQVKKYLDKLDKKGTTDKIEKASESKRDPEAYKWGAIRKILKRHFGEN